MVDTPNEPAAPNPAPGTSPADTLYPGQDSQVGASPEPAGADTQPAADTAVGASTDSGGADTVPSEGADSVAGDDSTPAPVDYSTMAVPEGLQVNDAMMTEYKDVLKEANIPPEVGAKVLTLLPKVLEAQQAAQQEAFRFTQERWLGELHALPEFSTAAAREQSLTVIGRVLDEYGTQALRDQFNLTGLGNHPDLVKLLHSVGQALGEGAPARPGTPKANSGPKTLGQSLYPDQK